MEKAKAAVSEFIHNKGHHDTTVHERVAPAVTQEHITKKQHEEKVTALDREVHQDHYHTSVQPVQDREVLPEEHRHHIIPVEHRSHDHDDKERVKARLEQEAAQFKDSRVTGETEHTHGLGPQVVGEHHHHHVHETIQPVVQKETIQPSVVHTTVPIHEVHHNAAKHHSASTLPALSMADFKKQGGALSGREERYDAFEGEPRSVSSSLSGNKTTATEGVTGTTGNSSTTGTTGTHQTAGHHHHGATEATGNTGPTRTGTATTTDNSGSGFNTGGTAGSTRTGVTGPQDPVAGGVSKTSASTSYTGQSGTGPHSSGLANKVDPRVDSDRDGKKGLLD